MKKLMRKVYVAVAAVMLLALLLPMVVFASTSGGATIFNAAKVTYTSGTNTNFSTATVSITVLTVSAAPSITNPANRTVIAGDVLDYGYLIKSNANGLDTYVTSNMQNVATGVAAAINPSLTANVQLWGGIVVGSVDGAVKVPFGTTGGLVAGTSTIQIGANQYTVSAISLGSAAAVDASGNLVAEVPASLSLAPISGAPAIAAGGVTVGTQIGEFKAASIALGFTAANPSAAGTDGIYSSTYVISSTITPVQSANSVAVVTTVSSPKVTISKVANKAEVKPGEQIDYTVTITNTHTAAKAINVSLVDLIPAYTKYVANSAKLNGIAVAGDGTVSPVASGILVDANMSRTAGAVASGELNAGAVATVTYSVIVD